MRQQPGTHCQCGGTMGGATELIRSSNTNRCGYPQALGDTCLHAVLDGQVVYKCFTTARLLPYSIYSLCTRRAR